MFKVGFTGTKETITSEQINLFNNIIIKIFNKKGEIEFHHGDCVGADATVHNFSDSNLSSYIKSIIIHPPSNPSLRANCTFSNIQGKIVESYPYLERNKHIVDSSELIIAIPKDYEEEVRSGTWSTVRYAKRSNKSVYIIYPDGSHEVWPNPKLISRTTWRIKNELSTMS